MRTALALALTLVACDRTVGIDEAPPVTYSKLTAFAGCPVDADGARVDVSLHLLDSTVALLPGDSWPRVRRTVAELIDPSEARFERSRARRADPTPTSPASPARPAVTTSSSTPSPSWPTSDVRAFRRSSPTAYAAPGACAPTRTCPPPSRASTRWAAP